MPQINAQRLGWLELTAALLAGLLWYRFPQVGWLPLLLLAPPLLWRAAGKRLSELRSPLDLFILLFLATAVIGLWTSYDPAAAAAKFWTLIGAVCLYYALAAQPRAHLQPVVAALVLVGVGVAALFLLSNDWSDFPSDLGILNRIGLTVMAARPELPLGEIMDNSVGGILAGLLPLALGLGLIGWREKRRGWLILAGLSGGFMSFALIMTSSRGSWLALTTAVSIWFLWSVGGRLFKADSYLRPALIGAAALLGGGALWLVANRYFGGFIGLANALPGLPVGTSRYQLAATTLHLAGDFLWTGGGLAAFAGLYSHYILVIPFFIFSYSHNFYLDLLLEQGLFGLLSLLGMLVGAAWLLWRPSRQAGTGSSRQAGTDEAAGYWRWGVFTGLMATALHGFVDSALYSEQGTPFLFVWAGLAAALARPADEQPAWLTPLSWRTIGIGAGAAAAVLLLTALFLRQPLAASWQANLGAVKMAQVELADFPSDEWVGDRYAAAYGPAVAHFERALAHAPDQAAAHYRLGMITLETQAFATAVNHLEQAQAARPAHPGIHKRLAYSYLWAGDMEQAAPLLDALPETRGELESYAWWWQTLERPDLARRAQEMGRLLRNRQ
jgi:O-antigen ligase